jgi:hypothetical protein
LKSAKQLHLLVPGFAPQIDLRCYANCDLLSSITNSGIERQEIRREVDARGLATLIISLLEGALMVSRLELDRVL